MSDLGSEDIDDQGPNLGVGVCIYMCISVYLCTYSLLPLLVGNAMCNPLHVNPTCRHMRESVMRPVRGMVREKLPCLMEICMKAVIRMASAMARLAHLKALIGAWITKHV